MDPIFSLGGRYESCDMKEDVFNGNDIPLRRHFPVTLKDHRQLLTVHYMHQKDTNINKQSKSKDDKQTTTMKVWPSSLTKFQET